MALPDYFVRNVGTAIVLADVTDHAPAAANNLGTRTAQIDLTDLANSNGTTTGGRQSDKFDFGENRAAEWGLAAAIELVATPSAGNTIDFYLSPSNSPTAATANSGNASGADSAYAGYASNLDATLPQLDYIGSMVVTANPTGTVQKNMRVAVFEPTHRYGSLIVVNRAGSAMHSVADEMSVVLYPLTEAQID